MGATHPLNIRTLLFGLQCLCSVSSVIVAVGICLCRQASSLDNVCMSVCALIAFSV